MGIEAADGGEYTLCFACHETVRNGGQATLVGTDAKGRLACVHAASAEPLIETSGNTSAAPNNKENEPQ